MNRVTVWLIGSNASGKTTLAKHIHKTFNPVNGLSGFDVRSFIFSKMDEKTIVTTKYVKTGHVGAMNNNQCTGTDTISKKEMMIEGYQNLLSDPEIRILVIDGIMATGTWTEFLKNDQTKLLVVLLDFDSVEENIERVVQRRIEKKPHEAIKIIDSIKQTTYDNLQGKINGFQSLYRRVSHLADTCIKIKYNDVDMKMKVFTEIDKLL